MSRLPDPLFLADSRGLDFLNSIATPYDEVIEWLGTGNDLLAWSIAAGFVPAADAKTVRKNAAPGELDAVASEARALRERFRAFVVAHKGKQLRARTLSELAPLNRILARDEQYGEIQVSHLGNPSMQFVARRRWRTPQALLAPIASAIAEVICNEDFRTIKACPGHNCTLFFVDRTRGSTRRWCTMAICGNRAEQAAHRKRAAS
jgi:predicted RNA-binding Zn ribbon-like protein